MKKTYTVKDEYKNIIEVYKWLRINGTTEDYEVVSANYRSFEVRFNNNELELKYILKYDWRISQV